MPSHAQDHTPWLQPLLDIQPDRIMWIREAGLDPELVEEYQNHMRSAPLLQVTERTTQGGERMKHWDQLPSLFHMFAEAGLTRSSVVMTTGGGALSDAVGLAASLWKRGMRVLHVPTTTLSAVDAAWGGKTGINWNEAKNQIGTFHHPLRVHLDARWLRTLPQREFRAGLAEAAKHAMLSTALQLEKAPTHDMVDDSSDENAANWTLWLTQAAQVKRHIVEQDPTEQGVRITLNLGHTVGHALESIFLRRKHPLLHGEAVAVGLMFALYESRHPALRSTGLETSDFPAATGVEEWLRNRVPLPQLLLPTSEDMWANMVHDKKNVGDEVRDVAWRGVGKVVGPVAWKKEAFEATWIEFVRCWNESLNPL